MKTRPWMYPIAATALSALAGCASSPPPVARVASAEAAMRAADESGAENVPAAALHLHYARQQRTEGQRMLRDGEHERASMQYQRVEADANLALALAHEAEAQRVAQGATDELGSTTGATEKSFIHNPERNQ